MMTFHQRLVSELTQLDMRESKGRHHNPYALGHYLQAAQNVEEAIASGENQASAFADNFTPTRGMHAVARRLGLPLDVQRGRWIEGSAAR